MAIFASLIAWPGRAEEQPDDFTGEIAGIRYVETRTGSATAGAELPMLIALHYMGGSPATSITDYSDIDVPARLLSLAGLHSFRDGYSWFPDGYYELDEAEQLGISLEVADRVAQFIREAVAAYPTVGKPVMTGYSQGADLTHLIALRDSELISAGLPMGGRFPDAWLKDVGEELPAEIGLFHGGADEAVNVGESLKAARFYTEHGVTVTLHTYAGVGHAYPPKMKADFEVMAERLLRESGR